jgi:hypothetical protein
MMRHQRTLSWALAGAGVLILFGFSEAAGQFLPMPGQTAPGGAFPPPPGQSASPFPPPRSQAGSGPRQNAAFPPPPGQQDVCAQFPAIRAEAEKGAAAIRAAGERKAPREEMCNLFKSFAAKEARFVKFLVTNQAACGVPAQAISQVKSNHAKTLEIRKAACSAGPAGPAGPSLSDALGGPIIANDAADKRGGSTFDTLTGNVLGR